MSEDGEAASPVNHNVKPVDAARGNLTIDDAMNAVASQDKSVEGVTGLLVEQEAEAVEPAGSGDEEVLETTEDEKIVDVLDLDDDGVADADEDE
jgi:hypothetical protein